MFPTVRQVEFCPNARFELQTFLEQRIGSIEPGKDADIAVWDKNMYAIPTDAIKDLKCELTLVAGKIVYGERPLR